MTDKITQVLSKAQLATESKVPKEKLITINEYASVGDALQQLSTNKISSVPVVDEEGDPCGTVDILDIVTYLYEKLDPEKSGKQLDKGRVSEFLHKTPVLNICCLSARNQWTAVPETSSVAKVKRQLSNPNVHRVYLIDANNKPCGVFTQKNLVEFLMKHKDEEGIKEKMQAHVRECWPGYKAPVSVGIEESMLDAFKMISKERVSGLAVLDSNGGLLGNISASDLKNISHDIGPLLESLQSPIRKYLESIPTKPIVVEPGQTVESMIHTILTKNVHRVFVVDSKFKPTHEISLCDIIAKCTVGTEASLRCIRKSLLTS